MQELGSDGATAWISTPPPGSVPVPAVSMMGDLSEQHAIVVSPGRGILTDLRIYGEASTHDGQLCATVVSEAEYWRARLQPGHPVAGRRVPLDRLFVEYRLDADHSGTDPTASTPGYTVWNRLAPSSDSPGARIPVPARTVPHLHGRRLVQSTPLGWAWNLRAISEPHERDSEITVSVVSAEAYYRWLHLGEPPAEPAPLPLFLLWAE